MRHNDQRPFPKIAVLMAVHNGIQWLDSQVKSILAQQNVNIHLFINVDKSQDSSESWCKALAERETQVTLLTLDKYYGSATKNFLHLLNTVDFSDFDYISFSDQDDIWHVNKLHLACIVLQKKHYQGYSSNVTAWWGDDRKKLLSKSQKQKKWDYIFESGGPGCTYVLAQPLAMKIKKRLQDSHPLAAKLEFHDWFFYAFTRAENIPWYIDSQPSMLYRQHASNTVGINQGWRPFIRRAKKVLSGSGFEQSILTTHILFLDNGKSPSMNIPITRWGFLKLALKSTQCRRRVRDQFYFFLLCILITLIGPRKDSITL